MGGPGSGLKPRPAEHRFYSRLSGESDIGCWLMGTRPYAYHSIRVAGRQIQAHVFAYELLRGAKPEGMELDHLCRNTACVNPWHLDPVPHRINMLRSPISINAINLAKTHCPHGHLYSKENIIWEKGRRRCRICRYALEKRRRSLLKNAPKLKARRAVNNAIRDRRLVRQPCEICGVKAEAHHEDYSKALEIRWLCVKHHRDQELPKPLIALV